MSWLWWLIGVPVSLGTGWAYYRAKMGTTGDWQRTQDHEEQIAAQTRRSWRRRSYCPVPLHIVLVAGRVLAARSHAFTRKLRCRRT